MDVRMPELNGLGATEQIRTLPAPKCHILIVALTADALGDAWKDCIGASMDGYLAKLIDLVELLAMVNAHCSKA
jgi:CheY-like chemotaxis protein